MRMLGNGLLWAGVVLGALGAVALLPPGGLHGLSWILGVGVIKLCLASAAGLMAGGAFLRRFALRAAERQRALATHAHTAVVRLDSPE